VYSTTPPVLGYHNVFENCPAITIHVPIGSGDAYKAATNWSGHANNIIEDIEI
jgi:hypothetical protein